MGELDFIKGVLETGGIPALSLLAVIGLIAIIWKHGFPHKSAAPDTAETIGALAKTIDGLRAEVAAIGRTIDGSRAEQAQMHLENERRHDAAHQRLVQISIDTQVLRERRGG